MKPFLLHLLSPAGSMNAPTSYYDEALSVNLIADCAQPVVKNQLALGTLTKTEAKQEADDSD